MDNVLAYWLSYIPEYLRLSVRAYFLASSIGESFIRNLKVLAVRTQGFGIDIDMGSSVKKKRDKKKDFQKPKLKVGKTRPKADNFTDTSFKAKCKL